MGDASTPIRFCKNNLIQLLQVHANKNDHNPLIVNPGVKNDVTPNTTANNISLNIHPKNYCYLNHFCLSSILFH